MLFAQAEALGMDYWIDKGVMGVLLFFIIGFIAKLIWAVWNFYKPQIKEKHDSVITLQTTLTENSGKQTEILTALKNTLTDHSMTCVNQQAKDAEAHDRACVQLQNIHEDLDKFRKEATDPKAPFATVTIHEVLKQICVGLRAGVEAASADELKTIVIDNCTKIEGMLE